jgi:hypothetical protein
VSARQLHNAHYQLRETIIRYRFHPRYGQTVIVTSRNRRGNDVAVTIRQPDGTLAQLPIWMTEDSAEAMAVTEIPRLPLAHLREPAPCISFGALRVDEAVGAAIVRLLQPLGVVEAAIQAITQCEHQSGEKQRQVELALEQARYEATRARRQYDTVDP